MGEKPREELMSSLKGLYTGGEYSDLTIIGRGKHYLVHKAIVCPRSEYLATASRKASAAEAQKGSFSLTDDDPLAVDMVFDYLYHLDYPAAATAPAPIHVEEKVNGHVNGVVNGDGSHPKTNGHAGPINDIAPFSFPDTTSETKEESLSIDTFDDDITSKKDKKKKKKKKGSLSLPKVQTEELSPTDHPTAEVTKEIPTEEPKTYDGQTPEETVAVVESPTSTNIVTHAKVYALSKKYKIDGLKDLALEKFKEQVQECWASEEFLEAAKVVYESTLEDDGDIRNAVTTTLYEHPELLDKKETQEVIKGLALGFDLLMRVRNKGGFGS